MPSLNQRQGEDSRRKFFMTNIHERMLPDPLIKPATVRTSGRRASDRATAPSHRAFEPKPTTLTKRQPTIPHTSELAAIIRAAVHNRGRCLFILNFCYLFLIFIFREWRMIRLPVHTFRPSKLSYYYHFSRNINGDVCCRSVN